MLGKINGIFETLNNKPRNKKMRLDKIIDKKNPIKNEKKAEYKAILKDEKIIFLIYGEVK